MKTFKLIFLSISIIFSLLPSLKFCDLSKIAEKCVPDGAYCLNLTLPNSTTISKPICSRCRDNLLLSLDESFDLDCVPPEKTNCNSGDCRLCLNLGKIEGFSFPGTCLFCGNGKKALNGKCVDSAECPEGADSCLNMKIPFPKTVEIKAPLHCYSDSSLEVDYEAMSKQGGEVLPSQIGDFVRCAKGGNRCMISVKTSNGTSCAVCHRNYVWEKEGESCRLVKNVQDDGEENKGSAWVWILFLIIFFVLGVAATLYFLWNRRRKNIHSGANLEYLKSNDEFGRN